MSVCAFSPVWFKISPVLRKLRMGPLLCSLNADRRSPLSRAIARPRMSESLGEGLSLHLRGNADRRQIPALGNL